MAVTYGAGGAQPCSEARSAAPGAVLNATGVGWVRM